MYTPTEIQTLKNFIHQAWGTKTPYPPYFPGSLPISIERKHFEVLKRNDYKVCEKTDGVRTALVCLMVDSKKITCIVNRAMEFTPIKMFIKSSAYKGTILDAELVSTESGKQRLMVYDSVIVSGENVGQMNFDMRLAKISSFLSGIMKSARDPFEVKIKTFTPLRECKDLIDKLKVGDFDHGTDGLIFTPVNEPVRVGTHETLFKWKPLEKNTVDFLVKVRPNGEVALYVQERGDMIFESIYNPMEKNVGMPVQDGDIVECQYQSQAWPRWWKPLLKRTDKKHPNNRRTLRRTMVNIEQNIQLSEFLNIQK